MKNPNISCRSHWNPSDKTASLFNKEEMLFFLISLCFHALCRANLISTAARLLCMKGLGMYQCPQSGKPHFYPALSEPAVLAALRARFCM